MLFRSVDLVRSGLEETMITATREIMDAVNVFSVMTKREKYLM